MISILNEENGSLYIHIESMRI